MHDNLKKSILGLVLILTGCQTQFSAGPHAVSEAALVAQSAGNGLSAEIALPYLQVYQNLRQAYNKCISYTKADEYVYSDNRLEQDFQMGTLFARTKQGAYVHKMLVEGLESDLTRITLFVPSSYSFAKSRFKQDIVRAKGQDTFCNQ